VAERCQAGDLMGQRAAVSVAVEHGIHTVISEHFSANQDEREAYERYLELKRQKENPTVIENFARVITLSPPPLPDELRDPRFRQRFSAMQRLVSGS
jgi:hypothetical protein